VTPASRFFPFTFLAFFAVLALLVSWSARRLAKKRKQQDSTNPMEAAQESEEFLQSSDRPLTDPAQDRLGYANFARHLAESFSALMPQDGLVVAIYGPWGSGKTTLLNFIRYFLNQSTTNPFVEVSFNPWWFPRDEDLVYHFFAQLRAVISRNRVLAEDLANRIAALASLVSSAPVPGRRLFGLGSNLLGRRPQDVNRIKSEISGVLRSRNQRILVVMDDIDRLSSDDIRHLFGLIKGVADFPNVLYLLAFDRDVVVDALRDLQGVPGDEYLEKIVQVPFHLPIPDRLGLRMVFAEKLTEILGPEPHHFDQGHWVNVFNEGIDHFIQSPRDIVRLINALAVTFPAVRNEVNPVDFVAVETIRVFTPAAYEVIRQNSDRFAGASDSGFQFRQSDIDTERSFHDGWLGQIQEEDRNAIKALLERLFPKFATAFGGAHYGAESEREWRRELRVCSTHVIPVYFRLAVPEETISSAEMNALLALAGSETAFSDALLRLADTTLPNGTSRVRAFLERLTDYTDVLDLRLAEPIVGAFFAVGDQLLLPSDARRGLFDFGNDIRMGRVMWQLLKRFDERDRFRILREAMERGTAISFITHEVITLGQQHGKYSGTERSPEEQIVTKEHLQELEAVALGKIRLASEEGRLLTVPQLPHVLYRWRDWGDEQEVRSWIDSTVEADEALVRLISSFYNVSYSYSDATPQGVPHERLDPEWLRPFVDPEAVIERVRGLLRLTTLTTQDRRVLERFVLEFEMRERGENPDDWSA
jgi:predicted KAP-like P-loop ATPase